MPMNASDVQTETSPQQPAGNSGRLLGQSEATQSLLSQIKRIAPRSATVLIEGETGVGKEMTAREIHARSLRAGKPFVPVDCTAFSSHLIESQLFGHVKGAFTGAVAATLGFMRCAEGGTLFLDEIGELPLPVQAKLLRCVQERTVVPVGGVEPIPVNLRIIAATHRDLAHMAREGTFRQDLYFRINVVRLTIQPLRERSDDIVPLAAHFLEEFARVYEETGKVLAPLVAAALLRYDWPGNVRELRNALERAFLFCNDRTIDLTHLPTEVQEGANSAPDRASRAADAMPSLAESERMLIARVLKASHGNQSEAARVLDVERHRLRRLIARHGLAHLLATKPR
jgi:transcriptional regulator with PAS, ATPase and Fis domain